MNEKTRSEILRKLEESSEPLIDLLYEHYHPHAKIIITQGNVEIVEGSIAIPNKLRD